ncbi:hypothetical protein DB812_19275, partial [Xanthomonas perforans]
MDIAYRPDGADVGRAKECGVLSFQIVKWLDLLPGKAVRDGECLAAAWARTAAGACAIAIARGVGNTLSGSLARQPLAVGVGRRPLRNPVGWIGR